MRRAFEQCRHDAARPLRDRVIEADPATRGEASSPAPGNARRDTSPPLTGYAADRDRMSMVVIAPSTGCVRLSAPIQATAPAVQRRVDKSVPARRVPSCQYYGQVGRKLRELSESIVAAAAALAQVADFTLELVLTKLAPRAGRGPAPPPGLRTARAPPQSLPSSSSPM